MVANVVEGWTPERDAELKAAARKKREEQQQGQVEKKPAKASTLDHYLYFPKKKHAEEAAKRLKDKGWQVQVRMGADNKNWLVLARQTAPINEDIDDVRDELETLAEQLHGEYDGWGAPLDERSSDIH